MSKKLKTYLKEYRLLVVIDIFLVLFVIVTFKLYDNVKAIGFLFMGSMAVIVGYIGLKYNLTTRFNKEFARKTAINPFNLLDVKALNKGTVIFSQGLSARIVSVLVIILGLVLLYFGFKNV